MNDTYRKQLDFLCDVCNRNMSSFDVLDEKFSFWDNSDIATQGYGFKFFGTDDKFLPIFIISYGSDCNKPYISIMVENRNGNDIIYGNVIAIYKLEFEYKENMSKEEIQDIDERYKKMVEYTIDKWACYNEQNMLGYVKDEERESF